MGLQDRHGVRADAAWRNSHRGSDIFQKILNEFGNVLSPLGQRRDANWHHRKPVKKILAKAPLGDGFRQIPAGRRDDPDVDEHPRGAADALKVLIDQNPEDFRLRLARHVGDFVQIKRAAVRLLKSADPRGLICAGLDPE